MSFAEPIRPIMEGKATGNCQLISKLVNATNVPEIA
jgi:hypothetical protein